MYSNLKLRPCLVLLLSLSPLALAQLPKLPGGVGPEDQTPLTPSPLPPSPPPPPTTQYSLGQSFNPTMAIVMVAIISAFFVLGFFSVYIRQCMDRRYRSTHGGSAATQLDQAGAPPWARRVPVGLDASVINTFPTFLYSAVKGLKVGKVSLECAVCLNEFEDDDTLRLIPKCSHVFHPDCIDAWLASHVTCPVCRANLAPRPGDLPLPPVELVEPDGSRDPDGRSGHGNDGTGVAGAICIAVVDEGTRSMHRETQSQEEANLLYPAHENRSSRSWSSRWRLREKLFPRSHSTGHSLVQPGENLDRFTLQLPEEVRTQIMETARLNRTKSSTVFPRARSTRKGYRSASVGSWRGRNFFNYERFDHQGWSDRGALGAPPPSLPRAVSIRSGNDVGVGEDQVSATLPKNFQRSSRSFHLNRKKDGQTGEVSSNWLRSKSTTQVQMVGNL